MNMETVEQVGQKDEEDADRVYTWENAPAEVRKRILEVNRYWEVEDRDWWDFTYEDAKGVHIEIEGFDCYSRDIQGRFTASAMDTIEAILKHHGEDCETYKTAERYKVLFKADHAKRRLLGDEDWEDPDGDLVDDLRREILKDYLRMLDEEYDYLTSDECLTELFAGSDYEFDANGNLV